MNVAFITLGKRDLEISNNNIYYYGKNSEHTKKIFSDLKKDITLQNLSEFILNNLEKYKSQISFPILTPFIDHLKLKENKIDRLIIVGTNQIDAEEYYKKNDTYSVAKIIKEILQKDKFFKAIKIIQIKKNVSDMDCVFDEIKKHLRKNKFLNGIPIKSNIYLLPLGGIPTINFALTLNLITKFKMKVQQYRVDEKTAEVTPISFNEKFLLEMEKFTIENLLKQFFFASISETSSNEFIKLISEYAYNRMNFNFSKAFSIIETLYGNPDYREKLTKIYNDHVLLMKDFKIQLKEIFFSAVIKIIQKQYVDALLRLYNFTDNLLLNKICKLYNLKLDQNTNFQKWWEKVIKDIRESYPDIENKLEKTHGDFQNLNRPSVPLYQAMIKYKNINDGILQITEPLIEISQLRNKSIAAHGFEGVSLEKINSKLDKNDINLEKLIEKIEKYLEISFDDSVYNKIMKLINNSL